MSSVAHEKPLALSEQFDDLEQQRQAGQLGMWVFLATEVILFGGLFTGYTAYRVSYPDAWRDASQHMHVGIGSINTAVLLTSSLFMALAVRAAQLGQRKALVLNLVITLTFGAIFLLLKAYEYHLEIDQNLLPFVSKPPYTQKDLFLVFYWIMTGLHATHMLIGMTVLGIITLFAWRGRYSASYHNPVEVAGLYWHFVDIVWIFILPTLYLIHPAPHW